MDFGEAAPEQGSQCVGEAVLQVRFTDLFAQRLPLGEVPGVPFLAALLTLS
ncbi:hypothetical protein [Nostoc sp. 'Peltigera malacea cyanobiont' DB3992]|uniref:hypothetical protein n=1 Tax=Nostoc sp. 'Peltigera malacea cyanobiont' DB3992 TaxID=1206980 RepID=UPI0015D4F032|nr:hypothetical protein [Nostoc sp. 'Peltigera malacea cyanobiont' DB3992]